MACPEDLAASLGMSQQCTVRTGHWLPISPGYLELRKEFCSKVMRCCPPLLPTESGASTMNVTPHPSPVDAMVKSPGCAQTLALSCPAVHVTLCRHVAFLLRDSPLP